MGNRSAVLRGGRGLVAEVAAARSNEQRRRAGGIECERGRTLTLPRGAATVVVRAVDEWPSGSQQQNRRS